MSLERKEIFEFGLFRLDVDERSIERLDGQQCSGRLSEKAFQTLVFLIRQRGHLVSKDQLLAAVWPDTVVEENNLDKQIHHLRRFLGEKDGGRKYIETVPKHGYRFVEAVSTVEVAGSWLPDLYRSNGRAEPSQLPTSDGSILLDPQQDVRTEQTVPIPAPQELLGSGKPRLPRSKILIAAGFLFVILVAATSIWIFSKPGARTSIMDRRFSSEALSTNGNVFSPAISPNGRYVAYISRYPNEDLSVWIRDLDDGSNVEIIPANGEILRTVAFSPDSSQVYFVRGSRSDQEGDIFRSAIFGGTPKKVVSGSSGQFSVSPNGSSISFVRCPDGADESCSLWIANAFDGSNERRLVTRLAPYRIANNAFSSDGQNVAFAAGQSMNMANDFGLFSVSVADGTEKRITTETFFNIKGLVWLADRDTILIAASRIPNRTFRIWEVSIADGAVAAMTNDTQSYSELSVDDRAERLVASAVGSDFSITVTSRPTGQTIGKIDNASLPSFGPNGRVYFMSTRSGSDDIWCANLDGSQLRQLTTDAADDRSPVAGRDHLYFTSNRTGEMHVWRAALDGANAQQLTTKNGGYPIAVSADEKWVYYVHALDRTLWRIATDDKAQQKVLAETSQPYALSPSFRYVAFSRTIDGKKVIMITELGTPSSRPPRVFDLPDQETRLTDLAWFPEEDALLMSLDGKRYDGRLLRLTLDDGSVSDVSLRDDKPVDSGNNISLSPDGQMLAVAQGRWTRNAVLIHGLK